MRIAVATVCLNGTLSDKLSAFRALAEDADGPHIAEEGQQPIQPHSGRQFPQWYAVSLVHRKHEGQRTDQVGRYLEQSSALAECLENEPVVSLLEVA